MRPAGDIDYKALDALVEWHIAQGTDGIVAMGTTGESATLDPAEHLEVIRRIIAAARGRVPIIAGTGANSTREAIDLTVEAKRAGADAGLSVTPYYNRPPQEGLYQHFKAIAEAVDLPVILYNVPSRTGCDLLPETVARLAQVPNIVGVKEASGKIPRIQELLDLHLQNFAVYSGDDATACESILMGGWGDVSVVANAAPRLVHEMCAAALAGDRATALRLDAKLQGLHKALFLQSNPIPVKWALHTMGHIAEGIRLPLVPLDAAYQAGVRTALRQAEVEI
ncbi:MAG: 4-hydroxy-tetrahydrodipicolinate synthase [Nevskiaceae bacterium]|nr:MAG: 4-hydroxy-tetrahydrodipicolinate synthase [Nevskiaceae bacterium]TBR71472.1 MAG: 4-hydroxy-tetrahydrodipicolinate synthase [Nevskiaceae bacterium]